MNTSDKGNPDYRDQLRAFLYLLERFRDADLDIYNALAMGYDEFARPWDEVFAKPAFDRMFEVLRERAPKGGAVLDAGCGTGLRLPQILEATDPREVAALDISPNMLELAERKKTDSRVFYGRGDVRHLPFADDLFDAVVSTWTVELIDNPHQVVSEYLRVIKPGGVVVYTFVTLPSDGAPEGAERWARHFLWNDGAASPDAFAEDRRPFHTCERSLIETFREGVLSMVALGKCCSVEAAHLPCHEVAARSETR